MVTLDAYDHKQVRFVTWSMWQQRPTEVRPSREDSDAGVDAWCRIHRSKPEHANEVMRVMLLAAAMQEQLLQCTRPEDLEIAAERRAESIAHLCGYAGGLFEADRGTAMHSWAANDFLQQLDREWGGLPADRLRTLRWLCVSHTADRTFGNPPERPA